MNLRATLITARGLFLFPITIQHWLKLPTRKPVLRNIVHHSFHPILFLIKLFNVHHTCIHDQVAIVETWQYNMAHSAAYPLHNSVCYSQNFTTLLIPLNVALVPHPSIAKSFSLCMYSSQWIQCASTFPVAPNGAMNVLRHARLLCRVTGAFASIAQRNKFANTIFCLANQEYKPIFNIPKQWAL